MTFLHSLLNTLHRLFIRPLDPPTEHEVECPRCMITFWVDCED